MMLRVLVNGKDSGILVPDTKWERDYWAARIIVRAAQGVKIKLVRR